MGAGTTTIRKLAVALSASAVLALSCAAGAFAQISAPEGEPGSIEGVPTAAPPTGIATLAANGDAVPPAGALVAVQNAIRAANRIRKRPYIWGGGHRSWKSKGYDCSGAVSYVLHAAGLLDVPL